MNIICDDHGQGYLVEIEKMKISELDNVMQCKEVFHLYVTGYDYIGIICV